MGNVLIEYSDERMASTVVLFEVASADLDKRGLELVADSGEASRIVKVASTLRQQFGAIKHFTDGIFSPYESDNSGPAELVVEFGVKLGLETGLVIARGTTDASITVKATWKRSK